MLSIARAGPDDVVYDLGCGDGRMLLTAVKEFGVKRAVGYEIRKDLCGYAASKILNEGLEDKITLVHGDLFDADLHKAAVITLYLNIAVNERLRLNCDAEQELPHAHSQSRLQNRRVENNKRRETYQSRPPE